MLSSVAGIRWLVCSRRLVSPNVDLGLIFPLSLKGIIIGILILRPLIGGCLSIMGLHYVLLAHVRPLSNLPELF